MAFLARYPSTAPHTSHPDGAAALCAIVGLDAVPVARRAAQWALAVADRQLADPRNSHLWDEGGWIANRRWHAEPGNLAGQPRSEGGSKHDRICP